MITLAQAQGLGIGTELVDNRGAVWQVTKEPTVWDCLPDRVSIPVRRLPQAWDAHQATASITEQGLNNISLY